MENQVLEEIQREYLDFLDDEDQQGVYHRKVKEMVDGNNVRLLVNINDLRAKKPTRAENLLKNFAEEQTAFQSALKEFVATVDPSYEQPEFFIGYEGSFGNRHVTPRTLCSNYLNNLICLEGIVTQCSLIKPKLVKSIHYCSATQKFSERQYTDLTSLNAVVTAPVYPTKDIDGNLLETEYGLCVYRDHQTLTIQEMPEKAPAGQLPRAVEVILDDDLSDKCKPGDRVQIIGFYRCLPSKRGGYSTGMFRTVVIGNHVCLLSKESKFSLSAADIASCRKMAKKSNIFEILSNSLAPSIQGHDYVKKAILCMLLGGVEKVLPNGTRLRGDVNVLLIGDPSVAKSQLLRYVIHTAPRAIATTGRGSSGVGLTAAVTSDHETGEKRLEAGAMVLADRGVVCIDEFDKMSDADRTAIHEVMEQGRITIAKAGIHARLNARCSVLAAANPVYGKYDQYKPPMENIGLQDSILSRFDLLFVMLDVINPDVDVVISDHVVRMHRYRNPREQDGEVLPMGSSVELLSTNLDEDSASKGTGIKVFEKYDPLLHGLSRTKKDQVFTVAFMRIYIHLAKSLKPQLTEKACEAISEEYSRLRSQDAVETGAARTQPVTVRTLETLIRLATAHAKARLSMSVELKDAKAAIELVQYAYFKKVLDKPRKRQHADDDESDGDEDDDNAKVKRKRKKGAYTFTSDDESIHAIRTDDEDIEDFDRSSAPSTTEQTTTETAVTDQQMEVDTAQEQTPKEPTIGHISDSRFAEFKKLVASIFQEQNVQNISKSSLINEVNTRASEMFTDSEVTGALTKMSDDNQVLVVDGTVFLI
ncbi:hypothetical protein O3M35_000830 [Rhynocoris fuscipes]|uniref:DNA replication licensing factor MCM3 n=1 Tax=Rhynocoris fuscipes TaxID=488301 RepID=A0AAW1DMZ3_9HEMI